MSTPNTLPVTPLTIAPLIPSFHPHLHLSINSTQPDTNNNPSSQCRIHLSLTLPDALFLEPSTLPDAFASQPVSHWTLRPEVIDIERPVRDTTEVSRLDLEVRTVTGGGMVDLDIPTHARYLAPSLLGSETTSLRKAVSAGWVCRDSSDDAILHLVNSNISITLPTGKTTHQPLVELGTATAIWLGFAWLVYKMLRLHRRLKTKLHVKRE